MADSFAGDPVGAPPPSGVDGELLLIIAQGRQTDNKPQSTSRELTPDRSSDNLIVEEDERASLKLMDKAVGDLVSYW